MFVSPSNARLRPFGTKRRSSAHQGSPKAATTPGKTSDRRIRAHFVGAPFFVSPNITGVPERFAATGSNTGNLLIGDAVARQLNVDIVSFGTVADPAVLNDSVDVIVIPSANFLSPVVDLSWLMPVVEGTTPPVLMVGVGAQFPTMDVGEADLPPETVRLMKMISERTVSIGVRGQFTADVLARHGIRNTRVTGCPSLFRLGKAMLKIRKPDPRALVPVFNGSSNVLRHAYSTQDARVAELKLLKLAMAFDAPYIFQNELPEMLWQAGQSGEESKRGCASTLRRLDADLALDDYLGYIRKRGATFFSVDEWAEAMAKHNVIVGTRFHGNTIGISQGIAAVFVAHDSRTTELCDAFSIPSIGLGDFASSRLEDIVEKIDYSAFERGYPDARGNLQRFFEENSVPHLLGQDGIAAPVLPDREEFLPPTGAENIAAPVLPHREEFLPPTGAENKAALPATDAVDVVKDLLGSGDHAGAVAAYQLVPETHPRRLGVTQLVAETIAIRMPETAVELCHRAIAMDPSSMKTYWICARALRALGRTEELTNVARAGLKAGNDPHWAPLLRDFLSSDKAGRDRDS
jgi:hypothetical protein